MTKHIWRVNLWTRCLFPLFNGATRDGSLLLFEAVQFVVLCYSNPRKWLCLLTYVTCSFVGVLPLPLGGKELCSLLPYNVFFLIFLQQYLQHMGVPGLGVESELQVQAYTLAMAVWDLSLLCHLCYSLQQCQTLNSRSQARGECASSWIPVEFLTSWATTATPRMHFWWS